MGEQREQWGKNGGKAREEEGRGRKPSELAGTLIIRDMW